MISHGKDIKVFSGNANPKLAEEICKLMGTKLHFLTYAALE